MKNIWTDTLLNDTIVAAAVTIYNYCSRGSGGSGGSCGNGGSGAGGHRSRGSNDNNNVLGTHSRLRSLPLSLITGSLNTLRLT